MLEDWGVGVCFSQSPSKLASAFNHCHHPSELIEHKGRSSYFHEQEVEQAGKHFGDPLLYIIIAAKEAHLPHDPHPRLVLFTGIEHLRAFKAMASLPGPCGFET